MGNTGSRSTSILNERLTADASHLSRFIGAQLFGIANEDVLAKRRLLPMQEPADFKPDLAQAAAGYALKVLGPQEFIITSKRDGTRFHSAELRSNGRDLVKQLGEAVDRTQNQRTPLPSRDEGIGM